MSRKSSTGYAKANVSAKKTKACASARISKEDDNQKWKERDCAPQDEGAEEANAGLAMLPRHARVHTRADIDRVMRKGRTLSSPFFAVKIVSRGDGGHPRFGFIVSNKISKRAVVRNRIKRRLREQMRRRQEYFAPGSDVIVIARPPLVNADSAAVGDALDSTLARMGRRHL